MKSFPVHTFLTHLRPHLDEYAVRWQMERWGEKLFPGVSTSKISYLTTGVLPDDVPAEILEEEGILPVGVGGGFLDEHTLEGVNDKPNECSASLATKALGLEGDEALGRIIAEVKHCDLTRLVRPSRLSTLVKVRHRQNPFDASKVLDWTRLALDALYNYGAKQVEQNAYQGMVQGVFEDLAREFGWAHEKALAHVRTLLRESEEHSGEHLTELTHIFKVLNKRAKKKAALWLREVLIDSYQDSRSFFKAVDEINKGAEGAVEEFCSERATFPVLTVLSDTEHIGQAARSRYCGYIALVIQRNRRGNNAIFLNVNNQHVQEEGLQLNTLVRMIRLREQTRLGHPQSQWEDLAFRGAMRRLRMWYYGIGSMFLNGSTSTPDVKPSKLGLPEILEAAKHAFNQKLTSKWRGLYGRPGLVQSRRGSFRRVPFNRPRRFFVTGEEVDTVTVFPLKDEVIKQLNRITVQ